MSEAQIIDLSARLEQEAKRSFTGWPLLDAALLINPLAISMAVAQAMMTARNASVIAFPLNGRDGLRRGRKR
jgi:hypothetical protein